MILQDLWTDLYEFCGEPPDLDPTTTVGQQKLTRYLNRAQRRVAFYRRRDGRRFRHSVLEAELFFKTVIRSGTAQGGGDDTITLGTTEQAVDDMYNEWLIIANSENKIITDYDGSSRVAIVHEDWDTNPVSTDTYVLYKRFHMFVRAGSNYAGDNTVLDPVDSLYSIQKLERLEDKTELEPAQRNLSGLLNIVTVGDPALFYRRGNKIWFDVPAEEAQWYRMEYLRAPADMSYASPATERPELAEIWHDGIILAAAWTVYKRAQMNSHAWSTRQELKEFMETTLQEAEAEWDRIDAGVEVEV